MILEICVGVVLVYSGALALLRSLWPLIPLILHRMTRRRRGL